MGAPTAKKRAPAKKTAVPAQQPELTSADVDALAQQLAADEGVIAEDGSIRPVQIGKRGRAGGEMEHIFTLDGVDYFIPKKPNRLLLVGYLRSMRSAKNQNQQNAATLDLLLSLLGKDAVEALESHPDTTDDDVADVMTAVTKVAFGALAALADSGGLASGN